MSKRRAKGEGSIYKRRDGTWCGALTLPGGKRRYVYGKTQAEVLGKMDALKQQHPTSDEQLLSQYLTTWLEHRKPRIRDTTYQNYEQCFRIRVTPFIGHIKLCQLGPGDIEECMQRNWERGVGNGTVRQLLTALRTVLSTAERHELVRRNVAKLVDMPKKAPPVARAMTVQQVQALLRAAREGRFYVGILLAVRTGMRAGEIIALRWDDIDFDSHTLHIRQGKTLRSIRAIRLPDDILIELQTLHATDTPYVLSKSGDRITLAAFRWQYEQALERAGLPHFRLHDLRHTAATLAAKAGSNLVAVQTLLGHSSASTTASIYTHLSTAESDGVVDVLTVVLTRDT